MAVLAETEEDLNTLIQELENTSQKWALTISVPKTKTLAIVRSDCNQQVEITIRGEEVEQVNSFTYLGSAFQSNTKIDNDISQRIAKASFVFNKMHFLWRQKRIISLHTKMRVFRATVIPTLLYGGETWPITTCQLNRLEVFQNHCLRSILGISLRDHVPNTRIRDTCMQPTICDSLRKQRLRWLGHVRRMDDSRTPKKTLFCTMPGSRPKGRPKQRWSDVVRKDLSEWKLQDWWRKSTNREAWRQMIFEAGPGR